MAVYFALNALHAILYITSKAKLQVFFEEIEVAMSAAAQIARRAKLVNCRMVPECVRLPISYSLVDYLFLF